MQIFLNKLGVYRPGIQACSALVMFVSYSRIGMTKQSASKMRVFG
jgi:hypothetical protein